MSRPCKLQINTAGAWRDLLRFDLDQVNDVAVQDAAASLVQLADPTGRSTLRVCMADSMQTTLSRWEASKGWNQV